MDVSFVILTWNSEKFISGCLDSIFSSMQDGGLKFEVHVVDNGSRDGTPRILRDYEVKYPGTVTPTLLTENAGTTVSRNMALRRATGKYICIMDSDVELRQGGLDILIRTLESDPSIGLVVPRILYPSGKWQKSFDRFPTLLHKVNRFFRLRSIEKQDAREFDTLTVAKEVDYAISALWLMRRELLTTVGLLDEKIFYSPEDVDYCLRVWKAEYRILYVPEVVVVHHTQEISRGLGINKAKLEHAKGLAYFFVKHKYLFKCVEHRQMTLNQMDNV